MDQRRIHAAVYSLQTCSFTRKATPILTTNTRVSQLSPRRQMFVGNRSDICADHITFLSYHDLPVRLVPSCARRCALLLNYAELAQGCMLSAQTHSIQRLQPPCFLVDAINSWQLWILLWRYIKNKLECSCHDLLVFVSVTLL